MGSFSVLGIFGHYGADLRYVHNNIRAFNSHAPKGATLVLSQDIETVVHLGLHVRSPIFQIDRGVEVLSGENCMMPALRG